jgi:hypothetical protein
MSSEVTAVLLRVRRDDTDVYAGISHLVDPAAINEGPQSTKSHDAEEL